MSHGTILFAALNNTIYFATIPKSILKTKYKGRIGLYLYIVKVYSILL